jgi:putative NADH-flavin reductase
MKIALIGASGFVGSAILKESIDRGHEVTAISRHPEKITLESNNLKKIKADVLHEEEVTAAVKGNDVVISAYNPGWANPRIHDEFLSGAASIQSGVKKSGVKRFFTVGGAGSLYVGPDTQFIDTPQFPAEWKPGALAAREYLNRIRNEKELEWTFLSPAIEMHQGTSGKRTGKYRSGLDNPVFDENGRSIISVEDMAIAILDEVENPKHIRRRFTVAY